MLLHMTQYTVAERVTLQHEFNMLAEKQLEVTLGIDRVLRINVDGRCVLRVRMNPDCEFILDTPVELIIE